MTYQDFFGKGASYLEQRSLDSAVRIHCPVEVEHACHEINNGYSRPPGHIAHTIEGITRYHSLPGIQAGNLRGMVCEALLNERIGWLRERGWRIRYPIDGRFRGNGHDIVPHAPLRRVELIRYPYESVAEYDCVVQIEGCWTLGEAKTAKPFYPHDAGRKITALVGSGVMGTPLNPAFILGVPEDHPINGNNGHGRSHFERHGGRVVVFRGVTADYISMLAGELQDMVRK